MLPDSPEISVEWIHASEQNSISKPFQGCTSGQLGVLVCHFGKLKGQFLLEPLGDFIPITRTGSQRILEKTDLLIEHPFPEFPSVRMYTTNPIFVPLSSAANLTLKTLVENNRPKGSARLKDLGTLALIWIQDYVMAAPGKRHTLTELFKYVQTMGIKERVADFNDLVHFGGKPQQVGGGYKRFHLLLARRARWNSTNDQEGLCFEPNEGFWWGKSTGTPPPSLAKASVKVPKKKSSYRAPNGGVYEIYAATDEQGTPALDFPDFYVGECENFEKRKAQHFSEKDPSSARLIQLIKMAGYIPYFYEHKRGSYTKDERRQLERLYANKLLTKGRKLWNRDRRGVEITEDELAAAPKPS